MSYFCPKCERTFKIPGGHPKWCGQPFNVQQFWDDMMPLPWTGCWVWTKATLHYGYGGVPFKTDPFARRVLMGIHRVAWMLTHGPIPKGMEVMHICDNPPCGNPSHLRLGTHADNMRDARNKGRNYKGPRDSNGRLQRAAS